jgi:hypothetical protein
MTEEYYVLCSLLLVNLAYEAIPAPFSSKRKQLNEWEQSDNANPTAKIWLLRLSTRVKAGL